MLQFIRNRAKTFLVQGVLWLIILAFVGTIFLVWGRGKEKSNAVIAKVGGSRISRAEYFRAYKQYEDFYRQQLGGIGNLELLNSLNLQRVALDSLISRTLQLNEARKENILVSDEELADSIYQNPSFQSKGKFDKELYLRILAANHLSPSDYENAVRTDLTLAKLGRLVRSAVYIPEDEVREQYLREKKKVQAAYLIVSPAVFRERVQVTDEALKKYYQDNKESFRTPEKREVELLVTDPESFKSEVSLADEELNGYFQGHPDEFSTPEKIRASHILVALDRGADEETTKKAKEKLTAILKELDSGVPFEDLARKYSDDPGSKEIGGELGYFARGQMVREFEEAAFALNPGEVAREVRSSFGFHVIKMEERVPPSTKSFDEVKEEIRGKLTGEKTKEMAEKFLTEISKRPKLKEEDWSLLPQQFLKLVYFKESSESGKGLSRLPGSEALVQAIFGTGKGAVGPVTPVGPKFSLPKVLEIVQPVIPSFGDIQPDVRDKFTEAESKKLMDDEIKRDLERLKGGTPLEEVAGELGLEVKNSGLFQKEDFLKSIPTFQKVRDAAFALEVGEFKSVQAEKVQVILKVVRQEFPGDAEFQKDKEEFKKKALASRQEMAYEQWMKALRDRAEKAGQIQIREDLL